VKFENEQDLMDYFKHRISFFRSVNPWDLIPHQVMSHGFMEWTRLLAESFPSMAWRGQEQEAKDSVIFIEYMSMLFKRFWIRLMQEDLELTEKQKQYLLVEGWKEFLND